MQIPGIVIMDSNVILGNENMNISNVEIDHGKYTNHKIWWFYTIFSI